MREDWELLTGLLPGDWEELAEETGALKGLRKDKSVEKLLRTLLLHVGCGHSLRETVAGRVCAVRKTQEATRMAQKRLRKAAAKTGKRPQPETLSRNGTTSPTPSPNPQNAASLGWLATSL